MNQTLFYEIDKHLTEDPRPSVYLQELLDTDALDEAPYTAIKAMAKTEQNPRYHPEGDVFAHTLLVVDQAAAHRGESKHPRAFMWAALLHDIGKPETTKLRKGRLTAYDHDIVGEQIARRFLEAVTEERELIDQVANLVRFHMQPFLAVRNRKFARLDELTRIGDWREVALLGLCDRLGRGGVDEAEERQVIAQFVAQMEL